MSNVSTASDSPTGQRYVADEEFDTQSLPVTESGESIPDTARSTLLRSVLLNFSQVSTVISLIHSYKFRKTLDGKTLAYNKFEFFV